MNGRSGAGLHQPVQLPTLAIESTVRDWRDVAAWQWAFAPLASRRTQPFLAEAGIPEAMAGDPQRLLRAARGFLRGIPPTLGDQAWEPGFGWRHSAYRPRVRLLLRGTFDDLAAAYGQEPAHALFKWASRHEIDRRQWLAWRTLGGLLPWLAGAYGRRDTPSPPSWLDASAYGRFLQVTRTHFSRSISQSLASRIDEARSVPLSTAERRLLDFAPEPRAEGDAGAIDDLLALESDLLALGKMIHEERVHRAWRDLQAVLTPRDLLKLLKWVRREAPGNNTPPEAIQALRGLVGRSRA